MSPLQPAPSHTPDPIFEITSECVAPR
jgi:hypothetical protein